MNLLSFGIDTKASPVHGLRILKLMELLGFSSPHALLILVGGVSDLDDEYVCFMNDGCLVMSSCFALGLQLLEALKPLDHDLKFRVANNRSTGIAFRISLG